MDSIKDIVRSSVKVPEFNKHLKKAGGHIGRNAVEITIKMKTIVRKPIMIKIGKKCLIMGVFMLYIYLSMCELKYSSDICSDFDKEVKDCDAFSKTFKSRDQKQIVILHTSNTLVRWFLRHINPCKLSNVKSSVYIYLY